MTKPKWPTGKKPQKEESPCIVCSSPRRASLDADARRGDGITALARRYDLSQAWVRKHLAHGDRPGNGNAIVPALKAEIVPAAPQRGASEDWSTATIVEKLSGLEGDLRRLATSAEQRGFVADATNALREVARLALLLEEHRPDESRGPEFPELGVADVALLRAMSTEELWEYAQTGVIPTRFRAPSPATAIATAPSPTPERVDPYAGLTRSDDAAVQAAAAGRHTAPAAEPQPASGAVREGEHHERPESEADLYPGATIQRFAP